ncbi:MAG: hypothetical protein EHM21_09835, partial [Chloroflexi bacterium]
MNIDATLWDNPEYLSNCNLSQKGLAPAVQGQNPSPAVSLSYADNSLSPDDTTKVHAVKSMGSNSYGYDPNGNMTKRLIGGVTYTLTYDAENRLVSYVGGSINAAFVYDGDGQRVKGTVTIGGTTLVTTYVGSHYEVQGTTTRKYYFAGAQRIAMRENGALYFFLSDHLGSTAVTVDSTGNLYGELRYSAWGQTRYNRKDDLSVPVAQRHDTPTRWRYTGQFNEIDLGIYFYGARWLD